MMRIGIDIDGVLNNQHDFCIQYGTKYCNEIGKYKLENIDVCDTTDMFLWGDKIAHDFWDKYRIDLVSRIPARKFASEVINKLKDEGCEIYIITARYNGDEWFSKDLKDKVENITINWLRDNNIIYDKIIFNSKDKAKICLDNNIDVMIEDDCNNIDKLINNTRVIIFDAPYNRRDKYKNIQRCYSWYDIYCKLRKIKDEKIIEN